MEGREAVERGEEQNETNAEPLKEILNFNWDKSKSHFVKYSSQLLLGISLCSSGVQAAVRSSAFRSIYKEQVILLFVACIAASIGISLLYIPIFIFRNVWLSWIIPSAATENGLFVETFNNIYSSTVYSTFLLLIIFRSFPQQFAQLTEGTFFSALQKLDATLCKNLKETKPIPFDVWFRIYRSRLFKLFGLYCAFFVWTRLPYPIAFLAVPAAQFLLANATFGVKTAVVLTFLQLIPIPGIEFTTKIVIVKFWFNSVALSRELMEPLLSRVENYSVMSKKLRKKYFVLLLGFAMPWALTLSIPLLGPAVFAIAQGSAASLALNLSEREDFVLRKEKLSTEAASAAVGSPSFKPQ